MDSFIAPDLYARGEPNYGSMWGAAEEQAVLRAFRRVATNGPYFRVEQDGFEADLSAVVESSSSPIGTQAYSEFVSLNSCGAALDVIWKYLQLGETDEVITSGPNFFGGHMSVLRTGARLSFCDSAAGGVNIDPHAAARALTANTKAIFVTHMNGHPVRTDILERLVNNRCSEERWSPPVIVEDAARSLGAAFPATQHVTRVFSFHRKKTISTLGEGGAIQTSDRDLARYAREFRSYGLGVGDGSSARLTEPQAAVGREQLRRLPEMRNNRRQIVDTRQARFTSAGLDAVFTTLRTPGDNPYYHMIALDRSFSQARARLTEALSHMGIGVAARGAIPTYMSHDVIARRTGRPELANDRWVAEHVICLPLHPLMGPTDEEAFARKMARAWAALAS